MASERKCCNCDFWSQFDKNPNIDPAKDTTDHFGECRINPPGLGEGEYLMHSQSQVVNAGAGNLHQEFLAKKLKKIKKVKFTFPFKLLYLNIKQNKNKPNKPN